MPDPPDRWHALLRDTGCSRRVIAHCIAVRNVAMEYAKGDIFDAEATGAGALLHDIGRSRTHGIAHAQSGAALCREKGVPERIARIVECHLGAGLTADECTQLHLLPIDCIPRTPEEKVVAHADNLVAGTRRIHIEERMMRSLHLSRKMRKRLFHLWLEMEVIRSAV